MPKRILYESAVHQFMWAAQRLRLHLETTAPADAERLGQWIKGLTIENPGGRRLHLAWTHPQPGAHDIALQDARFYTRGDSDLHAQQQAQAGLTFADDRIMAQNMVFFDGALRAVLAQSGLFTPATLEARLGVDKAAARKHGEEVFHDEWASSVDVTKIDVRHMAEACTAPELRYIRKVLGDLKGRTLLDVGCGLGEASVYFALLGAEVTSADISSGMCDATRRLAEHYGVKLATHISAAEDFGFPADRKFDIIYMGNLLHHVDIAATMQRLVRHLKPNGMFFSWDPVAYNPVINVYRRRAMEVRTVDEHPLRLCDIRLVQSHFRESHTRWFWLTALLIFCLMAAVERRDPNKERYWKKIVEESHRWAWLYRPLELLDKVLLTLPFLRPLCWNVVIAGRGPR
jgi:SAM-dependent methyltransferase